MFDFRELELLMSGLPEIDVEDWKANTEYQVCAPMHVERLPQGNCFCGACVAANRQGEFNAEHTVVKWLWEVVESLPQEMRAKLLQVPMRVCCKCASWLLAMTIGTLCCGCGTCVTAVLHRHVARSCRGLWRSRVV